MIEDIGQQKEAAQGYSPQAQLMLFGHMCVLHKNTECDVKDTLLALWLSHIHSLNIWAQLLEPPGLSG